MAKKEHTEEKENILKEAVEEHKKHGFYQKKDEKITVFFLDGTSLTGKLNHIGRYEIFLIVQDKSKNEIETTIFKNAIKYII